MHSYVVSRGATKAVVETGFYTHYDACMYVVKDFCERFKKEWTPDWSSIKKGNESATSLDDVIFPVGWSVSAVNGVPVIDSSKKDTFWHFSYYHISRVVLDESKNNYFIWSNEHSAWWKPKELGYTKDITKAGIYPKPRAMQIVLNAMKPQARKFVFEEVLVPCDEVIEIIESLDDKGEADDRKIKQ